MRVVAGLRGVVASYHALSESISMILFRRSRSAPPGSWRGRVECVPRQVAPSPRDVGNKGQGEEQGGRFRL